MGFGNYRAMFNESFNTNGSFNTKWDNSLKSLNYPESISGTDLCSWTEKMKKKLNRKF